MIPWCVQTGVACVPYSPLASGVLCRAANEEASARAKTDAVQKMKSAIIVPLHALCTLCLPAHALPPCFPRSGSAVRRYYKAGDDEVVQAVRDVATKRGVPQAQVALAWVLQKKGVAAPIIGATKEHHIADAVAALQLQLTEEEVQQIEAQYQPHIVVGPM